MSQGMTLILVISNLTIKVIAHIQVGHKASTSIWFGCVRAPISASDFNNAEKVFFSEKLGWSDDRL